MLTVCLFPFENPANLQKENEDIDPVIYSWFAILSLHFTPGRQCAFHTDHLAYASA